MRGEGLPQDKVEGAKWIRRSAMQGFPPAQSDLGLACRTGDGVTIDLVESYKWYFIAQRGLDPGAFPNLMKLAGNLSPEQKNEALTRAQAFVPLMEPRPK